MNVRTRFGRGRKAHHQCCPKCDHLFSTQWGVTHAEKAARRERVLAIDFSSKQSSPFTDDFIEQLFQGTNFGEPINNSTTLKRKQLVKTLTDQLNGFWSGHTAYHMVVDAGLLKDAKTSETKQLTALGELFLKEHEYMKGDS
ncbi:hypothetical protein [Neptuniibacter sp. QD37_11]|uniref:hypothetical protein n=1 Tax=Neptuniibacter sp. QD37_11 TaxID=3398209 RepID=UPI0039F466BB